jgi:hypothetical protein
VGFLADLLAAVALGLLKAWLARADLKRAERERLVIERLQLEQGALLWLAEARRNPPRWARLRVLYGAVVADAFTLDAAPPDGAAGGDVPPGGPADPVPGRP